MNWELIILLTGLMLFCYWLNYIMGGPLSDDVQKIDVKAILFSLPYFLAIHRLKRMDLYKKIHSSFVAELQITSDRSAKEKLRLDHKLEMYLAGRQFFIWERSLLCPICLHWWLTVLVGFVLITMDCMNARADFFIASFVYLLNHLIIRKIS